MKSRTVFASVLTTCILAFGLGGMAPAANAASVGQSLVKPSESAGSQVIEIKRRGRHGPRFVRPIGPSYRYYDYPYYASRGYYPSHIGPGFIYHYPGSYERDYSEAGYSGAPHSAKERCGRRFRSFEWDSGLYTTYRGHKRLCPYLL